MQKITITLKGASTLLLHNGRLANPMDKFARQLKALTGKRKKQEEDYEAMAKVEFLAGLYLDEKGSYILPGHNLEAVMLEGAKRDKNGKQVHGGAFIDYDPVLKFTGSEKSPEELWSGGEHALMVSVCVNNRQRIMRTRPIIPAGWNTTFDVTYDPGIVSEDMIRQAFDVAGRERGIGDWRPKYGRFVVE
jgi:hypothetical protein